METILEKLQSEIPPGYWCHGWRNGQNGWCKYHEIKKPTLSKNGTIQCYFCNLHEEFVNRKICEINEDEK